MTSVAASYESSLLLTLGEISRLVSHSHDPGETLANIVRLIQGRFHTAVCSVYLFEPETDELVLGATVGLKPESVGRIRMRRDEGLTGLVAQRLEPVMVADAFAHPRFKYFPEAGEDPYHSFLGVPLVEGGELQGVLVVQTTEPREFAPSEVHVLVAVAAQLASLVGDARFLEQVAAAAHREPQPVAAAPTTLHGVALSPGSGVGQAYLVDGFEQWRRHVPPRGAGLEAERARLAAAMTAAREELLRLSRRISELVGEDHGAILQAQLMIMQDRTLEKDLDACLLRGTSAEAALIETLDKFVAAFQGLSTPFFQERVYDVKDVFHRLLWQLQPRREGPAGERLVVVAREASVMELFAVDLDQLAGVVVEHGGPQCHAAILARSLGIPMVGQVSDFAALEQPGRRLLVEGSLGVVLLDPPAQAVAALSAAEPGIDTLPPPIKVPAGLPRVEVNLNLLHEAAEAVRRGAAGVGLFRSEFLFLARRTLPTEEEQVGTYAKLLHVLDGRPVNVRTFDLRPDKAVAHAYAGHVGRPLDWRLVLDSPPMQQLFLDQVRAVLRAAAKGPARLLVPLVTRGELLDFVKETVARARDSLQREGLEFAADVPLGITIETAATAPLVGEWAGQVDFFALGTNDLTASALGLERDDPVTANLADPLHPGLLRLIAGVVGQAHAAHREVTVCGEMAADPLGAVALAALGVDALSVPVSQFEGTRRALASRPAERLASLRRELVEQGTATQVRQLLSD
jgi:phosphotransferase system enzyme I (PtsP)